MKLFSTIGKLFVAFSVVAAACLYFGRGVPFFEVVGGISLYMLAALVVCAFFGLMHRDYKPDVEHVEAQDTLPGGCHNEN